MTDEMMKYSSILTDIKRIIDSGRNTAYGAVNSVMLMTYWNIGTQYYYRLLKSPEKEPVIREMLEKTAALQNPEEIIKSPVIAEFLGFHPEDSYLESELESSIITHIRDFLAEIEKQKAIFYAQHPESNRC